MIQLGESKVTKSASRSYKVKMVAPFSRPDAEKLQHRRPFSFLCHTYHLALPSSLRGPGTLISRITALTYWQELLSVRPQPGLASDGIIHHFQTKSELLGAHEVMIKPFTA
jgi:hypothetical protein